VRTTLCGWVGSNRLRVAKLRLELMRSKLHCTNLLSTTVVLRSDSHWSDDPDGSSKS